MSNEFNYDNEIIEVSNENEEVEVSFEDELNGELTEQEEKTKKPKKKKKQNKENIFKRFATWFKGLDKKKKIIFIVCSSLIFLLLVGLIIFFILNNNDDKKEIKEEVILQEDNYRYENGKLIFLEDDKDIGTYECVDKDVKKCYVAYLDNESDTFDHETNLDSKEEVLNKRSKIYLSNYVFVYDDGKVLLYNIKDKKVEEKFKSIKAYETEKDYVVVEDKDEKFGVILFDENTYEYAINAYYDYLGIVDAKNLLLVSETDKKQRVIDIDNKQLSKEFSVTIKSVNKDYIAALSGKKYNLYSYKFDELLSGYEYISFVEDFVALVEDNKLYFRDSNLNKMNEEGIVLTNDTYNKINKYNKKNKLEESEVAYSVTSNKDNLSVTYGDDENKVINKYEGAVSANYSYMNYFDSKLYFYSDLEKNDLIGTYECKNKNKLTSENDSLTSCTVYANDKGVTGIYNNNFVFIFDNSSIDGNKVIKLYSLKENKNKATYSEIEFLNNGNLSNNVQQYYTEKLYVKAKSSSKNSYGIICLENTDAKKVIDFNYKNINLVNNYYVLENNSSKYSIWTSTDFRKISDEFDYVEVLKTHYVGINGKKLNVYRFETTTNKLLDKDLELTSTDYKKAYKITVGTYIEIVIGDKTYKYNPINGKEIKDETVVPVTTPETEETEDLGE